MNMGEITSIRFQEEIVAHEKDLEVVWSLSFLVILNL
jgi:hypothetical protein